MTTKKIETEIQVDHPLDEIFDIEKGQTLIPVVERETELAAIDSYDEKDNEIETQFQEVYDCAMDAFDASTRGIPGDAKSQSIIGEVSVQYLNTALAAAKEKANLKIHKDKMVNDKKKVGPRTLNQNVIVADRNDILKKILGKDE